MAEVKPALKNIAKAILEQDHSRKQAAKWRNSSYEPWKKGVQTVKETPFGGFNGTAPKANKFLNTPFDFSSPKPEPSLGQASINVLLDKAVATKKAETFGVKMRNPAQRPQSQAMAPVPALKRMQQIPPSLVPDYFDRGDLPVQILHGTGAPSIKWIVEPKHLDYKFYLPLFVDGLREKKEPYRLLSILCSFDMLESGGGKIIEALPKTVIAMKTGLQTRDTDIIILIIKFMKDLSKANRFTGPALVPYYRQLLPTFNQYYKQTKNTSDKFVYDQRKGSDLGEIIAETLGVLEQTGGKDAVLHIKSLIPTYESNSIILRKR